MIAKWQKLVSENNPNFEKIYLWIYTQRHILQNITKVKEKWLVYVLGLQILLTLLLILYYLKSFYIVPIFFSKRKWYFN